MSRAGAVWAAPDDDPALRLLCRVNLELEGFEVTTAGDGERALELAAEFRPDVITLDVMMPRLNGFETVSRLRQDPRVEVMERTNARYLESLPEFVDIEEDPFIPRGMGSAHLHEARRIALEFQPDLIALTEIAEGALGAVRAGACAAVLRRAHCALGPPVPAGRSAPAAGVLGCGGGQRWRGCLGSGWQGLAASGAVESVCCMMTSAPCSISACAASASLAGSNQV